MTNIYQIDFDQLRQMGDPLADGAFEWIQTHNSNRAILENLKVNHDLATVTLDSPLGELVASLLISHPLSHQIESDGQSIFKKYTSELLGILGLYSLPYCYAGAKGVRVLYHSKKIRENPKVRLLETAVYVFDVMRPGAFMPEGKALVSILKVRLIHAAIRFYSRKHISDEVAINQEDMAATLYSFSLISLRGLKKFGITLTENEERAYLSYWSHIGKLMGLMPDLIPDSVSKASQLESMIRARQFHFSEEGKLLTESLISYLETENIPGLNAGVRDLMFALLGAETAKCIDLQPSNKLISKALLSLVEVRNSFKNFGNHHFEDMIHQLEARLSEENVKLDFQIPF